jgi:hypothetical protein
MARLRVEYNEGEEPIVWATWGEGEDEDGIRIENVVGIRWRWDGGGIAEAIIEVADAGMDSEGEATVKELTGEDLERRTTFALAPSAQDGSGPMPMKGPGT